MEIIRGLYQKISSATEYRHIAFTTENKREQWSIMMLKPLQDIGLESHPVDQWFWIPFAGSQVSAFHGAKYNELKEEKVEGGDLIYVGRKTWHNLKNLSSTSPLKMMTLYCPSQHPAGEIEKEKPNEPFNEKEAKVTVDDFKIYSKFFYDTPSNSPFNWDGNPESKHIVQVRQEWQGLSFQDAEKLVFHNSHIWVIVLKGFVLTQDSMTRTRTVHAGDWIYLKEQNIPLIVSPGTRLLALSNFG